MINIWITYTYIWQLVDLTVEAEIFTSLLKKSVSRPIVRSRNLEFQQESAYSRLKKQGKKKFKIQWTRPGVYLLNCLKREDQIGFEIKFDENVQTEVWKEFGRKILEPSFHLSIEKHHDEEIQKNCHIRWFRAVKR